jgi:hypothetical protein
VPGLEHSRPKSEALKACLEHKILDGQPAAHLPQNLLPAAASSSSLPTPHVLKHSHRRRRVRARAALATNSALFGFAFSRLLESASKSSVPSKPSPIDPRWSMAHLRLLGRYSMCREAENFTGYSRAQWEGALWESCENAFESLVMAGLVAPCSPKELLYGRVAYKQAKQMLKDRGLKVSGRRAELIERLWKEDQAAMEKIVSGIHLFRCTESGQRISDAFLAYRAKVERAAFDALCARNADLGTRVICDFQDALGFPETPSFQSKPDVSKVRSVFSVRPKILAGVSEATLEHLRVAAGMVFLGFGFQWLPDNFQTGLAIKNEAAVRMIISQIQSNGMIEQAKERPDLISGVHVYVASEPPPCDACHALKNKNWKLGDQPELPYESCTHLMGCRCCYGLSYVGL